MRTLLAIIASCWSLSAATYYVDFDGGSDAAVGTSTGTAWRHCRGDANATGTAGTGTLAAGDTVIFRGGVTYVGQVEINWSGSAGSLITYDGNTSGAWGTGKAKFDMGGTYYHAFNSASAHHYIRIRGFDLKGARNNFNGTDLSVTRWGVQVDGVDYDGNNLTDSLGYIFNYQGDNWEIRDCLIHESEDWFDLALPDDTEKGVYCDQVGINSTTGGDNLTVSNVVFWAVGRDCLRFEGDGIAVSHCDFGGDSNASTNKGYFSVAIRLFGRNVTVSDCLFHDGWQYQGDESGQRSHAGDWIHAYGDNDGVFETGASTDPNNIVIERCKFWSDHSFSYANGTAYSLLESDVWNMTWRNNLFINSFSGGIEMGRVSNVCFYANTFIDYAHTSGGGSPIDFFMVNGGPIGIKITNNILISLASNNAITPIGSSSAGGFEVPEMDYNLYYTPNNGGRFIYFNSTYYTSLATWRTASGQDAHSVYGDPVFVDQPASGATSGSGDWSLDTGSPAINAGANLSTLFGDDYTGATRSGTWDIGAYDDGSSGGGDTTPPVISGISASPSTTSAAVTWTTDEAATSGLQWGLTTSYTGSATNSATVTSHSLSATSLSASTLYHYRVISSDASGNTTVGSDGTFTTDAAEPPQSGSTLNVGTANVGTINKVQ